MEDKDNLPLIVGALAGVLFAAFMLAKRYQIDTIQVPEQTAAEVAPDATASNPSGPRAPLLTYVVQKQPDTRTVYECAKNGQHTFSDSPCGEDAKTRTISPVNVMDAPKPNYRTRSSASNPASRNVTAEDNNSARKLPLN